MRATRLLLVAALLGAALLALPGCAAGSAELDDTSWVLEAYGPPGDLVPVLEGSDVTLVFNSFEANVRGFGGFSCYFGPYEVKGDSLSIGAVQCTESGIREEAVLEQERVYLAALLEAESYEVKGDELTIDCGNITLVYQRAGGLGS